MPLLPRPPKGKLKLVRCHDALFTQPPPKGICMKASSENAEPSGQSTPPKATLLQVVRVIVSGLFMIAPNRDFGPSAPKIGPVQLIIAALIGVALLIAALLLLVSAITH